MINITFFIGNGFDLNLGINTRYSNVIDEYLNIKTTDTNIIKFQNEFKNDYKNWSDFEKALGEYLKTFTPENINDFIAQVESFRDVLINKFKEEETHIDYNKKSDIITTLRRSLTEFDSYLFDVDKQAISQILSNIQENTIISYNFISFNYTNILDKCLDIAKPTIEHNDVRIKINNNIQYFVYDRIEKIIHIHGTLKNSLILGVDNVDQIKNELLKKDDNFIWKIVKPLTNKELKNTNMEEIEYIINTSSIICVFGMSIGVTDMTWWKYIVTWLKSNTSRHLVIFYYNDKIDETNPRTIIENRKNVENLFFSVVEIDQEQERNLLLDRIHIAYNENMFKMDILSSDVV